MVLQLNGKVALVTGGGSGIGRAASLAFCSHGAKVVVVDVNLEGGAETRELIEERGGHAVFVRADVTQATAVESMVTKTIETYGRLDCAFNNAGVLGGGMLTECTEREWDSIMNVNLRAVWLCLKYEILQMLKQGRGTIVNSASAAGLVGMAGSTPYVVSKHGVVGLTKTAALQYANQGIRVNAVCPGYVRTQMIEGIVGDPRKEEAVVRLHPMGRLGVPEDVAEAVVWLCSEAASFITGHALPVDGGYVVP